MKSLGNPDKELIETTVMSRKKYENITRQVY